VAELVSAPAEPRSSVAARLSPSPWSLLVAVSLALVLGGVAAFAAGWALTSRSTTVSSRVAGTVMGVQVHVVHGDVTIVGGAQDGVAIRRTARSTFGRGPVEWRTRPGGRLALASTCPRLVVGDCSASYRIAVPDNVPIGIRVDHGSIDVHGYRGSASLTTGRGSIAVDGFCGYVLRATSAGGDVGAVASCSPERLELRSTSGDVSAVVPQGRYRIDASSTNGAEVVRGLAPDPGAPWEIQALSTTGDVSVAVPG
jgi:hypothetical protein